MSANHVIPFSTYRNVLLMLLALTVLSVVVAKPVSGIDTGIFNFIVAMGIASVKAGLVMAYFMHLKYDNKLYLAVIVSTVLFLALLFGIVVIDWATRAPIVNTL